MKFDLKEILSIYKPDELNAFIKKYSEYTLDEKDLRYENIKGNWAYLDNNPYNQSAVGILKDSGKGLIERITNGIDSILEKEIKIHNVQNPQTPEDIIKIAFPNYYKNKQDILINDQTRQSACETDNLLRVVVNDSTKSNKPTIDVIDSGTGIKGENFINTILSIQKGNKSHIDKNYSIGAFGHGGSTSLTFSYATIIISKYDNKFYFTIIKKCELYDLKMDSYLYFAVNGVVPEITSVSKTNIQYLNQFIDQESGTLVRMIDAEIPREFRYNDVTKPGMLYDYINTELYDVSIPVKVIDNRDDYTSNSGQQARNSYGTKSKIMTTNYVRKENKGTISIEHNGREYKLNYYFILPIDSEEWAKDSKCKDVYKQFNVHLDPIIYTVNGQYIASEGFTKLKNAGLSFLQYRLLVEINLDLLGKDKYRFFSTDRSSIKDSDLTKGFLDQVIRALKGEEKIQQMNNLIASQSVNANIDNDLIKHISSNVKSIYNNYLKNGTSVKNIGTGSKLSSTPEEIYYDEIMRFDITTTKNVFYKNESVNIIITTNAKKSINESAKIYMMSNGRQYDNYYRSSMNGRIQYTMNDLNPGNYVVQFDLYNNEDNLIMQTDKSEFNILSIEKDTKPNCINKDLDLEIRVVDDKELIIDVEKNKEDKKITILECLTHDSLVSNIYGKNANTDEIESMKKEFIEPLALFVLFMNDKYDSIEDIDSKNQIILSFCKTLYINKKEKW